MVPFSPVLYLMFRADDLPAGEGGGHDGPADNVQAQEGELLVNRRPHAEALEEEEEEEWATGVWRGMGTGQISPSVNIDRVGQ